MNDYDFDRDDLLAAMVNTYAVDEETAARDLDLVLEKMKSLSLITEEA